MQIEPTQFAERLVSRASSNLTPLQSRQVGKRRPLMTVTSCGMSAMHRIVRDPISAGLRHDFARLLVLRHVVLRSKLIDDL